MQLANGSLPLRQTVSYHVCYLVRTKTEARPKHSTANPLMSHTHEQGKDSKPQENISR